MPKIREALEADRFKVENDWLVGKLQRSPKFRKEGNFFVLEKTARQEEKEQKQEQKQEMKDLTTIAVFAAVKNAGQISVNQLSEKVNMRKETLNAYLEKLENTDRIQHREGARNAKLYSVK